MELVLESAEHHFLSTLEVMKNNSGAWMVMSFSMSKKAQHAKIIEDLSQIKPRLAKFTKYSEEIAQQIYQTIGVIKKGYVYRFTDQDIVVLAHPESAAEQGLLVKIYEDITQKIGKAYSYSGQLSTELYSYQKVADQKLLSAERYEGYYAMSDTHKVSSISLRRDRREYPRVMVVEDDRFTATYATNILSSEYDALACYTGEEAIKAYIDKAPDIVFMDIHLPGLNGHETLAAIKAVDPEAFVVMLSVDSVKKNIVQASHIGAERFLKKPFSKEILINTVKTSPYIKNFIVSDDTIEALI